MDHLPVFRYVTEPYPRIPFLSQQPYDGLEMDSYPDRQAFDLTRLYSKDFTQHSPENTAAFLQTWLFYGGLYEVLRFQHPSELNQFIEVDSLGCRVSTKPLNSLISKWAKDVEILAEKSVPDLRARLQKAGIVQNTIHKIYHNLLVTPENPVPEEVTLSLGILGCTIDLALKTCLNLGRGRSWGLDSLAATRMLNAGWCPRDIGLARECLTEISMFCASFLERRGPSFEHWDCNENSCRLNNIDEGTYVTQHRKQGCDCQHLHLDQNEVQRIIHEGGIPVIYMTSPGMDEFGARKLDIKIARGTLIHTYVALQFLYDKLVDLTWDSVYSALSQDSAELEYDTQSEKKATDLMFKAMNSLAPRLERTITPIRQYRHKPLALWIDTVCVPLHPYFIKLAISQMGDVYNNATMTIVLDSELQSFTASDCSNLETAVRIGLTGWMRRAWTFQEGTLSAQFLRFLFADGSTELPLWQNEIFYTPHGPVESLDLFVNKSNEKMLQWFAKRGHPDYMPRNEVPKSRQENMEQNRLAFTVENRMLEEAKQLFMAMKILWQNVTMHAHPEDLSARIVAGWNGMRFRETSREVDKFICLAITCSVGVSQRDMVRGLMDLPAEERMKRWIQMQSAVPAGLLFIPGERYPDEGSRWIPKGVWKESLDSEDGYGYRKRDGSEPLTFTKPGFLLVYAPASFEKATSFVILDAATELQYLVKFLDLPSYMPPNLHLQPGTAAIILRAQPGSRRFEDTMLSEIGALLMNVKNADDRVYGSFLARVDVHLHIQDGDGVGPGLIPARGLENSQKWVIG
ncbi:hypothetical protein HJFPF1_02104 [Paramyrothecium foliicola]|nr:hypothetical protein HJFPF1_02104 [Paramyrothecium foliicola]